MKLPNGFGTITLLAGHRRRPYAVRKTINGHQTYLAYFPDYSSALSYLVELNKAPNVLGASITFSEAYHFEMAERRKRIADITAKNYDIAFNKCQKIHDKKLCELTVADLQSIIMDMSRAGIRNPMQKKVRQVFHNIYRYAIKYQILPTSADLSNFVDVDTPKLKYKKKPFNTRQLNRVKAIADDADHPLSPWAMTVVMMCFCGTRPSELLALEKSDVKLKSRTFTVRNSKTAAGRNRIVPISRKTLGYFSWWFSQPGKTLVADSHGQQLSYHQYLRFFSKVMEAARCNHTPHECRHTCATKLEEVGANRLAVKRILGHAVRDITLGIYTHKSIRGLKKAIDLL